MALASLANEGTTQRRGALRTWLSFIAQVVLVVILGSADDIAHALTGQNSMRVALDNALRVVGFENAHDLWIEPALQTFFTHTHDFFGMVVGYAQMIPFFNAMYGLGHVGITFAFALWMFLYRRPLFAFVRNIFLFTNALAILTYEVFPLAPPRLASGLRYDGHPFHFVDTVFSLGSGLKLGFNEFAAMPSLHVGWSLIVALTLFMVVRSRVLRFAVLLYPVLMLTTVIVTGNHYVADAFGALVALAIATAVALSLEWWRGDERTLAGVLSRLSALRYSTGAQSAAHAIPEQQTTQHCSAA